MRVHDGFEMIFGQDKNRLLLNGMIKTFFRPVGVNDYEYLGSKSAVSQSGFGLLS